MLELLKDKPNKKKIFNKLLSKEIYGDGSESELIIGDYEIFIGLSDDSIDENINAPSAAELLMSSGG